jgi:hypothetical protein
MSNLRKSERERPSRSHAKAYVNLPPHYKIALGMAASTAAAGGYDAENRKINLTKVTGRYRQSGG